MEWRTIEIRLSPAERADLQRAARQLGVSVSEIARQAMAYAPESHARQERLTAPRARLRLVTARRAVRRR